MAISALQSFAELLDGKPRKSRRKPPQTKICCVCGREYEAGAKERLARTWCPRPYCESRMDSARRAQKYGKAKGGSAA
jgi:hypothetical protein